MSGGAYSALSGMRARLEDLDRLASDLANVGTSGYKTERGATVAAERPSSGAALDAMTTSASGSAARPVFGLPTVSRSSVVPGCWEALSRRRASAVKDGVRLMARVSSRWVPAAF